MADILSLDNYDEIEKRGLFAETCSRGFNVASHFDMLYSTTIERLPQCKHICIMDSKHSRAIGMITLTDCDARNLSVRIENVWITPSLQRRKRIYNAILLLNEWLFTQGTL